MIAVGTTSHDASHYIGYGRFHSCKHGPVTVCAPAVSSGGLLIPNLPPTPAWHSVPSNCTDWTSTPSQFHTVPSEHGNKLMVSVVMWQPCYGIWSHSHSSDKLTAGTSGSVFNFDFDAESHNFQLATSSDIRPEVTWQLLSCWKSCLWAQFRAQLILTFSCVL